MSSVGQPSEPLSLSSQSFLFLPQSASAFRVLRVFSGQLFLAPFRVFRVFRGHSLRRLPLAGERPFFARRPSAYRGRMNPFLLVLILMLLFGGGGFYYGGPPTVAAASD